MRTGYADLAALVPLSELGRLELFDQIVQVVADNEDFRDSVREYVIDLDHMDQLWSLSQKLIGR